MVNLNQYLTDTCIGIYWLIISLYSLIIGNYWLRLSRSCHMNYRLNIDKTLVSVGLLLYEEFLMSGSNLSTHIFHVGNLSKSNSKSPKQNFWSQCHLDQNFMRISKIVVSVYAKGLSANNFCHAQRILSVKQPPPFPPHPRLPIYHC